jgi:hypothetical protein
MSGEFDFVVVGGGSAMKPRRHIPRWVFPPTWDALELEKK